MEKKKLIQDIYFYLVILISVCVVIFTYRVLLGPLVISALLAYLLYPMMTWISKRTPLNRGHVVSLVYFLLLGFIVIGFVYISPIIVRQARVLSVGMQEIPANIVDVEEKIKTLGFEFPLSSIWSDLQSDATQLLKPDRVFRVIRSASTNVIWVVVTFATSFYLLRDWEQMREWLIGLAPEDYQADIRRLHQEIKAVWGSYLRGQLMIMFLLGLLSGMGAAAIGLPGALILGILAGSLALIPTLGPATATAIAAIIAWTQGSTYLEISNLAMTILAIAIFQSVQIIEGLWLTPQIMGRRLQLHPGLVLVAVIGSLVTVGAILALVIAPLIGSIDIIIQYTHRKRAGLDPWLVDSTSTSTATEVYLPDD